MDNQYINKEKLLKWINEEFLGCMHRREGERAMAMNELSRKIKRGYFDVELDKEKMAKVQSLTYKRWMKQFVKDNNAIGDLARDIHADRNFPTSKKYDTLKDYFDRVTNLDVVLELFEETYDMYKWR